MMDILGLLQWPAMLITVMASWLVGSTHRLKRCTGFWIFLASNALWAAWGLHSGARALVLLQVCLALMNVRGLVKGSATGCAPQASDNDPTAAAVRQN